MLPAKKIPEPTKKSARGFTVSPEVVYSLMDRYSGLWILLLTASSHAVSANLILNNDLFKSITLKGHYRFTAQ
jgi:hypothetical protein